MPLSSLIIRICLFFILVLSLGCADLIEAPVTSLSAANKKFVKICKEEHDLDVIAKTAGKTVWVYLPIEDNILSVESKKKMPFAKNEPRKNSVLFLDGRFEGAAFNIEYDIIQTTKKKDPGYTTPYTEEYNKKQQALTIAIFRAYGDLGHVPGDWEFEGAKKNLTHKQLVESHVKVDEPPVFFVVVIADIKTGLQAKTIFCFEDHKKAMSYALPQDEYAKRRIFELKGDKSIINDKKGGYLDFEEITWPEFLTRQIVHRINFKYQYSDFQPTEEPHEEILKIALETAEAYDFEEFEYVKLKDLRSGGEYLFEKSRLPEVNP